MRYGQLPPDAKPKVVQPTAHGSRVKIEIQLDEFNRLTAKRAPALAPQQVAGDGLEIKLVGIFEKEDTLGLQHLADLLQHGRGVCHMVQYTDHRSCIEQAVYEG